MASNYKTKYKSITWNVDPDATQTLLAADLGYDPMRRAHVILCSGADANNTIELQISPDNTTWFGLGAETVPASGQVLFTTFNDVTEVIPRYMRLTWLIGGGGDPGDVTIEIQSKHLPSTMRRA